MSTPGQGVYTPDLRVQFVKGWLTGSTDPEDGSFECGDGKYFCAEATLPEIAELFYRVKTATLIEHTINGTDPADSVGPGPLLPRVQAQETVDSMGPESVQHGYFYPSNTDPHTTPPSPYVVDEYEVGIPFYYAYRDINDNERGLWHPQWSEIHTADGDEYAIEWYYYSAQTFDELKGFRTAFSFASYFGDSDTANDPPSLRVFKFETGEIFNAAAKLVVVFSGRVAIVRENPTDGFFAATNRFFIEMYVECGQASYTTPQLASSDYHDYWYGYPIYDSGAKYIMRLTTGDIEVKLMTDDYSTEGYNTGEYILHEATEWFPYGYNSPAEAVWNSATGEKL